MLPPVPHDAGDRPRTIGELLEVARHAGVARLDAHLLVAHHLGRDRAWVIAHDELPLSGSEATALTMALQQRAAGTPLAYLIGHKEFRGLLLRVSPAVLVPRPETEGLVDWALQLLEGPLALRSDVQVLDMGTGSGAIALAIKHACPGAQVTAVDCSEAALEVARQNAAALRLDVSFTHGPWWQAARGRRFDLVASNPPYIAAGDPHLAALADEPLLALTPGGDGLSALREIVRDAGEHLERDGWLLLEHGHDQAQAVCAMLDAAGFEEIDTRADLAGLPRCSGGRWSQRSKARPWADGDGGFAV